MRRTRRAVHPCAAGAGGARAGGNTHVDSSGTEAARLALPCSPHGPPVAWREAGALPASVWRVRAVAPAARALQRWLSGCATVRLQAPGRHGLGPVAAGHIGSRRAGCAKYITLLGLTSPWSCAEARACETATLCQASLIHPTWLHLLSPSRWRWRHRWSYSLPPAFCSTTPPPSKPTLSTHAYGAFWHLQLSCSRCASALVWVVAWALLRGGGRRHRRMFLLLLRRHLRLRLRLPSPRP
jgi:hypothetical protein